MHASWFRLLGVYRLGSRFDSQGKGWASVVLCKMAKDVPTAHEWASFAETSKQELHLITPASWDESHKLMRDSMEEVCLGSDNSYDEGSENILAPVDCALWTSGEVQPPLEEWRAVQGCLHSYAPGMR